ncbi:MAG: class III extradiol ring-cleavage dioxygenase [Pseudomonadota bacterium]
MSRPPVVFVSHGSPDILLQATDAVACWRNLGRRLPVPRGILVVSAHWQANLPTLSLAEAPRTLHDFRGFPPALQGMTYPAPGSPALALRTRELLLAGGLAAETVAERGLDHGAWVPLMALYPEARVPVCQLSLSRGGPAEHLALGRALAPLRDEGILILASGAITHNFAWLDWQARPGQSPLPRSQAFTDWVGDCLAEGRIDALADYRSTPLGAEAHPSEEHFLPLFVAMGAAGGASESTTTLPPERLRPAFTYGALAMDVYVWGDA